MADHSRTRFKAFITKYALTNGIMEIDAEDCFDTSPVLIRDINNSFGVYHTGDWHRTKDAALAKAEQMRVAKIASLKKSIAKLEKLQFTK